MVVERAAQTLRTIQYSPPELKVDIPYLILSFIGFLYLAIGLFTLFRGETSESRLFYFVTLLSFIVYVYTPAGDIDWSYKVLQMSRSWRDLPAAAHAELLPALPAADHPRQALDRGAVPAAGPARAVEHRPAGVQQRRPVADAAPLAGADPAVGDARLRALLHARGGRARVHVSQAAAVGKKQIKWIYLGLAFGFLPFLAIYIIPYLSPGTVRPVFTTISILPLAFIPLAFAVSILKYKLWDVEVVIKEVLAYSVTFVFGMIAFSTVNLLLSHVIEERSAMERNFLAFTSGLLIAGVLIPVKGKIESVIEMILYRESYRHRRTMTDFAQELATFHDVHELIAMMRERLRATLHIERMNLYMREAPRC